MPAAAIPVAASLAAPAVGAAGASALGLTGASALAPWLTAAAGGALTGGLGSYIMGQDPMKGALFGGLGGGLAGGIGNGFGSAADVAASQAAAPTAATAGTASEAISPSLAAADPSLANAIAATPAEAAKTGSLLGSMGKIGPFAALTLGSLALNKATGVPANDVSSKLGNDYKAPAPMNRQYMPVDPNSFLTSSPNRTYFNSVNPQVKFLSRGGQACRMAKGGRVMPQTAANPMPHRASEVPMGGTVSGQGDGMSDSIPAQLSDGEHVFTAPEVSALGNGSNKAGQAKLYKMRGNIKVRHFPAGKPKKALGLSSYMH